MEGETRAMRGLQLHRERGDEIVVYISGGHGVPSRTEPDFIYHVDLDAEDPHERCDCPDGRYGGHTCMHQVFVEAHLAARRRKEAPKSPARKRCSAPPMAVRGQRARGFLARTGA